MCLFTADEFEGKLQDCDEGELCWVRKSDINSLNLWEGDKVFFRLLEERQEFFTLKLVYEGEKLVETIEG